MHRARCCAFFLSLIYPSPYICGAKKSSVAERRTLSNRGRGTTLSAKRSPRKAAVNYRDDDYGDESAEEWSQEYGGSEDDNWNASSMDDDSVQSSGRNSAEEDMYGYDLSDELGSLEDRFDELDDESASTEAVYAGSWSEDFDGRDTDLRSTRRRTSPKASAWVGGDRRRPSAAEPRRSSSREVVGYTRRPRFQQGRGRGRGLNVPALNSAAIAQALKRKLGTAKDAVEQASSLAASTTKRFQREVKLVVSGSWESALLKATWPDDLPPDPALVKSIVEAVQAFKRVRDVTKNSAEHRVLLRKLWTKMSEQDWRTVTKTLFLFHSILRALPLEDHDVLRVFLAKMSRERDKRTSRRYFDLAVLCDVGEDGDIFRSFVERYGTYVFVRANSFSSRFEELDTMRRDGGWEQVILTLETVQKVLGLGLACQLEPEEETELTVLCLRRTALDMHQLWRRFHSALEWVLQEARDGTLFDGVEPSVVDECLQVFKDYYNEKYDEMKVFLADAEDLMSIYDLRTPDLTLPSEGGLDSKTERPRDTQGRSSRYTDETMSDYDEGQAGIDSKEGGEDDSADINSTTSQEEDDVESASESDVDDVDENDNTQRSEEVSRKTVTSMEEAKSSHSVSRGGSDNGTERSHPLGAVTKTPRDISIETGSSNVGPEMPSSSGNDQGHGETGAGSDAVHGALPDATATGSSRTPPGPVVMRQQTALKVEKTTATVINVTEEKFGIGQGEQETSAEEGVGINRHKEREEEDSAEEGAVDLSADELTFFDDATQPEEGDSNNGDDVSDSCCSNDL